MFDYILVGGGLQNGLAVLALRKLQPTARVLLLESAPRVGGNHTWCFHSSDVGPLARPIVDALVVANWSNYCVKFPSYTKTIPVPYCAVTSERLHQVVMALASEDPRKFEVRLSEKVTRVESTWVEIESGMRFDAPVVIDSRGPETATSIDAIGYQKFVGLECLIEPGSGAQTPILMDATVEQRDGYRFFYSLPFEPTRVLIEDTYYSDSATLDVERIVADTLSYAKTAGLRIREIVRQESGVLPLPRRLSPEWAAVPGKLKGGYLGGWFHPTTGYSFPVALRLAMTIARYPGCDLWQAVSQLRASVAQQQRYCLFLNRLLFDGFAATRRVSVFERFYSLPLGTVCNFYALDMQSKDRRQLICGRPPSGMQPYRLLSRTIRSPSRAATKGEP